MDEARSKQLTELLRKLQELDRRSGDGRNVDDMAACKEAAREYYNFMRAQCERGHTVIIHTKSGLSRREEIRKLGRLDLDNLVTTYSPNWDAEVCITPLNLVEGDYVEVQN